MPMSDSLYDLFDPLYGGLPCSLAAVDKQTLTVLYINQSLSSLLEPVMGIKAGCHVNQLAVLDNETGIDHSILDKSCQGREWVRCLCPVLNFRKINLQAVLVELDSRRFYLVQIEGLDKKPGIPTSDDSRLTYAMNEACDGLWDWNVVTGEVYFSPKLDRMLGFEPGERDPNFDSWFDLVHSSDADRVLTTMNRHLNGEIDFYDVEYRIRTKRGDWKQVRDRGQVCDWDRDGNVTRAVGMLSDITAYRELEQELRHTLDRFEDYALCHSDWFWEADAQLNITEVSSQFSSQTGVHINELKGKNLVTLFKDQKISEAARIVDDGRPFRNVRLSLGGQNYWISLSGRSVMDHHGQVSGYRGIGENINDKVLLENTVKAYQKNAEIMMERTPVSIGLVDQKGQFFYANHSFLQLLRADQSSVAEKYKMLRELSRPDKEVFQNDDSLSYEMILETLDGPRFYSVIKYRLYRADEKTTVVVTMVMDITFTRQQEVDQKKIEMVLDSISEGILITDAEYRIVSANRSMQETTGYSLEELLGNTPSLFSSGRYDQGFYQELWNEVHKSGKWRGDIWNRCRNGSVLRQHVSIQAIMVQGRVQHYIGIYSSAYQARSQRDSEIFAQQHDPLTSLPNRQLYQDRLHMACQRSRVCRQPVEITLVRICNMTVLNDRHGHTVGDQVLKKVAFNLQDALAMDDTLARYSADEFVVVRERGLEIKTEDLVQPTLDRPIILGDGSRVLPEYVVKSVRYPEQGGNPQRLMRQLKSLD